jgi:hypothetical protein
LGRKGVNVAEIDAVDFRPSEVVISVPPLTGTMGRCESEYAAALLVLACVGKGRWAPCSREEIFAAFRAAVADQVQPWENLARNPFLRPSFPELLDTPYARLVREEETEQMEFTPAGLERLRIWVPRRKALADHLTGEHLAGFGWLRVVLRRLREAVGMRMAANKGKDVVDGKST